ncbi:MAG: hypothetical protein N4A41_10520 [Crocinitomicaceae bacterium]|jgi:hypothetical protein|nr:hypothetical protein [Crocinitomicaceae bacterium]
MKSNWTQYIIILTVGLSVFLTQSSFQADEPLLKTLKGKYWLKAIPKPKPIDNIYGNGVPNKINEPIPQLPFEYIEFESHGKFSTTKQYYNQGPGIQTIKKTGKYRIVENKIHLEYRKVFFYDRLPSNKRMTIWNRHKVVDRIPKSKRSSKIDTLLLLHPDTLEMDKSFLLIKR